MQKLKGRKERIWSGIWFNGERHVT